MNYKEKIINILTRGELTSEQEEQLEKIFPELAENEDEKIRKALISVLKSDFENNTTIHDISVGDIIAWLEKQSEPNPYSGVSFEYNGHTWGMCARDNGVDILLDKQLFKHLEKQDKTFAKKDIDDAYLKGISDTKNELEKQGEQKPFDYENASTQQKDFAPKIESKFHEGDWVILTAGELSTTLQIVNVDTNKKLYWFNDSTYLPIVDEECLRLWTIQDAKDGDVLYSLDSKQPFIFKHRKPNEQAKVYCGINIYGKFFVGNTKDCIITTDKYIPATKEQHDLLFQKMKEAGYEWSDKDKKLIKTEEQSDQGPINDTNEEISEELKAASILHSEIVRNQSCIDEDFIDGAQWLKRQISWNEEDEKMLKSAVGAVWVADYYTYDDKQEIEDWLKSLKERLKGK